METRLSCADRKHAASDHLLPTYRILLSPQVCSLGAAHLREEGVEVGRFPLTAAPVFHPGDTGKTFTHWDFSNHYMSLNKTRQTERPTERYQGCFTHFYYREEKHLSYIYFFNQYSTTCEGFSSFYCFVHKNRLKMSVILTLHERSEPQHEISTHPNHLQVHQKSKEIKIMWFKAQWQIIFVHLNSKYSQTLFF